MTANEHRGEVEIVLRDDDDAPQTYTLVYDWNALARLRKAFGDSIEKVLSKAFAEMDVDRLAKIIAIGLERRHGTVDEAMIRRSSPPLMDTIEALARAFNMAFYGTADPPGDDAEPAASKPAASPPPRSRTRTQSRTLAARRSRPGSGPKSSGG